MKDEFADRYRAIKLRLAGQSVEQMCWVLRRSRAWFHSWWRRYRANGPDGLFDLNRARQQLQRLAAELERSIISIRQRLASQAHPRTRYSLIGARAILAELKALGIRPLPALRTIERVLQRNGISVPRVRLARFVSDRPYPLSPPHDSNQLHQLDLVGPIYLKGRRQRYYIFVCKDVFDGAVCLKLGRSRRM